MALASARKSIGKLTAGQVWGSANAHKNVWSECNNETDHNGSRPHVHRLPALPRKVYISTEYQRRICHEVSTAVHVRKACIWMRRTNPNTIDAFNAGRCFDQRRPIQERPESPCENGTADDLLWRFQISQSICASKKKTPKHHTGLGPCDRLWPWALASRFAGVLTHICAAQCSASFSEECSLPQDFPTTVPAQIFIKTDHRRTKLSPERKVLASQGEQRGACLNMKQIKTDPESVTRRFRRGWLSFQEAAVFRCTRQGRPSSL